MGAIPILLLLQESNEVGSIVMIDKNDTTSKNNKNLNVITIFCNGECITDSSVCGYFGLCFYTWDCIEHEGVDR